MPGNYTPSLDLPPELAELLSTPPAGQQQMAAPPQMPMQQPMQPQMPMQPEMPNYADGGMVGPDGMPAPMGMPLGAVPEPAPEIGMADVQGFVQQNPQAVQQIAAELQQLIATGELSPQQLQMGQQLAQTALNEPETYPQLRQYAIQQGLVEPQDMPEQYDQGVLFAIIVAAQAVTGGGMDPMGAAGMDPMGGMAQAPNSMELLGQGGGSPDMMAQQMPMNMRDGGYVGPGSYAADGGKVVGPGTSRSDSIPINVSTGEYVIPAHVVQMKGKEFFDKMLESYKPGGDKK